MGKLLLPRLDPVSSMAARWSLDGITPEKAITRLVETKCVPSLEANQRAKIEAAWKGPQQALGFLADVFHAASSLLWIDMETAKVPVEHDELILHFADASRGVFQPEAVVETWNQRGENDADSDYDVEFVHAGEAFRYRARFLGESLNVRPGCILRPPATHSIARIFRPRGGRLLGKAARRRNAPGGDNGPGRRNPGL